MKIDLITGFLGSGKTTFILKYAAYLIKKGLRLGLLEYDYGAINADMALLNELDGENCDTQMLAAACDADCLRRRFKSKLIAMCMSGYDRIIIEPSGVFDMDMFFDTLREPPLDRMCTVGNIIAVFNALPIESIGKEEQFFLASQCSCAGAVVLSRAQMASKEQIELSKRQLFFAAKAIGCRNFEPMFVEKDWNDFNEADFEFFAHCGFKVGEYAKLFGGDDLSFSSVSILNPSFGIDELTEKAKTLLNNPIFGNVIRVKGFVESGGKFFQLNASKDGIFASEINFNQRAVIIIGKNLDEGKIRDELQKG